MQERLSSLPKSEFIDGRLYSASTHLLNKEAKLVRATLLLSVAEALGANPGDFINLAVAVFELLHTSSLIHDDIIDRDRSRRGRQTVHMKYGTELAILAGNALISKAISMASEYGGEVTSFMARSAMDMCAGEVIDYEYQKVGRVPDNRIYIQIAKLKCASLIAASASVVALYRKDKRYKDLYSFGENIGIAFQVRDDIMDFMDSGSGSSPNLVSTIKRGSRSTKSEAIAEASKVNVSYVRKAVSNLPKNRRFSTLLHYANTIAMA